MPFDKGGTGLDLDIEERVYLRDIANGMNSQQATDRKGEGHKQ